LAPILCVGLLIMGLAFVSIAASASENMARILIVPFDIHAEKDQSFLKPAVMDMLYTRLSAEGRTIHVEKMGDRTDPVSAADAISMGQQRNVDYVLFGSITILGARISTDARLVGIAQEKSSLTFNEVGQDQGDIITHIEHLTTRINQTIFGVTKTVEPSPAPKQGSDNVYIHPEKLVIPDITPKAPLPPALPSPAMVIESQADKSEVSLAYWKSDNFSETIQGLSIADIDGDGFNETIFIGGKNIHVYRYQGDRFQEIRKFSHGSFSRLIRVDTADSNQNGKTEIFLTDYISSQQRLKSLVLEWNGQDFDIIAERVGWKRQPFG